MHTGSPSHCRAFHPIGGHKIPMTKPTSWKRIKVGAPRWGFLYAQPTRTFQENADIGVQPIFVIQPFSYSIQKFLALATLESECIVKSYFFFFSLVTVGDQDIHFLAEIPPKKGRRKSPLSCPHWKISLHLLFWWQLLKNSPSLSFTVSKTNVGYALHWGADSNIKVGVSIGGS